MDFMRLVTLICFPAMVWSHARLMNPPSRSSMWRLGFPTRKNFNDNALYCGGITVQWQNNGGKCGICGDPYTMPHPRDNEAGGKYGRGIISKRYVSGQVIEATVDVTTNHRGYFEFKLCPNNNPKKEASQECLDKHLLREAHGTGTRYYIGNKGNGDITVKLQLPKSLTCSQCVFQWTYVAGNNWGRCKDGTAGLGCGPQETFRGCADIAIDKDTHILNVNPNENDIESNHDSVHYYKTKDSNHPKETTDNNHMTYAYEVTKQSRIQGKTTQFPRYYNHSHHNDHFDHSYHDIKHHLNDNQSHHLSHNHSHHSNHNHSHHINHSHSHHLNFNHSHQYDYNQSTHFNGDQRKFHHKTDDRMPPSSDEAGKSGKKIPVLNEGPFRGVNRRLNHKYDNRHFYHVNNDKTFFKHYFNGFSRKNNRPIGIDQNFSKNGNKHMRRKPIEQWSSYHHNKDEVKMSPGFNLGGRRYTDFWLL